MHKVIELDERFPTGEFTVQPAILVGRNGRPLREQLTKTASEATDYIQSVQPKPGHTIILVLALGSYERYGLNRNADGFNENPYRVGQRPQCGHDACYDPDGWIGQKDVISQHYKSFEEHGKFYTHHQNNDPTKAIGDVIKAFWNPAMHRVELLTAINNALAPDLVERIADGKYPAVSMGCKIKYDVCTVCGHRAPTRKQYCEHMKFSARQVAPSGIHVGVLNPSPRWFDISAVVKPADQTGFMLKKVAEETAYAVKSSAAMGEYLDHVTLKKSALRKIADIDKVIRGVAIDHKTSPLSEGEAKSVRSYRDSVMPAVQQMPSIDDGTLKSLAQHPLSEILSTLSSAGVILTTPEIVKIVVEQLAPGTQLSEQILAKMVDMQGQIFDMFAEHPQLFDQLVDSGALDVSKAHVNPAVGEKAEKYLEKRSTISDYLSRALIPRMLRKEETPNTDTLTLSDPSTGAEYATNRGAAIKMHDAIARGQLAKILGGGALLAGGAKIVSSGLPDPIKPLAWGGAALLGHSLLKPDYGPHYMTDQGVAIPAGTELVRQNDKYGNELLNVALPIAGTAGLVTALGHDYEARRNMGQPLHDPNASIPRRAFDAVSKHVHDNPATSTLLGLVLYGMGKGAFTKKAADSVSLPEIDVDALAEKIGSLFFE